MTISFGKARECSRAKLHPSEPLDWQTGNPTRPQKSIHDAQLAPERKTDRAAWHAIACRKIG
ncbi:MAG: hypothetical protein QM756_42355 [Polyangiaceae bacterium]